LLGLKALNIGEGDEVITSSMSFVASANAIAMTGATPVFADIQDDFNIDLNQLESLITSKTKAIMPVHYGGKVLNMSVLMELSKKHELPVIEDASQAFGAEWRDKKAGTFGTLGCISLNPMKPFSALGEAGIILTDDIELKEKIVALRYNGLIKKKSCNWISLNGRLDTIQAAMLIERLKRFENVVNRRRMIASYYNKQLKDHVDCPLESKHTKHVYYTYTIKTSLRDKLKKYMEEQGIEVKINHAVIMDEPAYKNKAIGKCEKARSLQTQKLSIPCNEKITDDEAEYITSTIKKFFKNYE